MDKKWRVLGIIRLGEGVGEVYDSNLVDIWNFSDMEVICRIFILDKYIEYWVKICEFMGIMENKESMWG